MENIHVIVINLSELINNKYCVKTPKLDEREKISHRHVNNYKKGMKILRLYANGKYNFLILLNVLLLRKCIVIDYFLGR